MKRVIPLAILILGLIFIGTSPAIFAQEPPRIQIETGLINPGDFFWYRIPDLQAGQTLAIRLNGISGNLDPIMGLISGDEDTEQVEDAYLSAIQDAIVNGSDPLIAAQQAADEHFLTWDDDGGPGLSAELLFEVPASGDYQLVISNALNFLGEGTFGDYELILALDPPAGFSMADAQPDGDRFAVLDRQASSIGAEIEETTGILNADAPQQTLAVHELNSGDMISLYIEAVTGDWHPQITLLNYAGKPLRIVSSGSDAATAALDYIVEDHGRGLSIRIQDCCNEQAELGEYRLLAAINSEQKLTDQTSANSHQVIKEPIPVAVGLKLQQIVEVDEQNEFFSAVASLQMEWNDPALAFSPDECDCTFRTYTGKDFDQFQEDTEGFWPDFTFFNQQGNRWTQNRIAVIWQDGHALYFERFSTNFQVDFDFRKYPFDNEEFNIIVDSIFPEDFYTFTILEDFNEISPDHGEDEFQIGELQTEISSEQASTRSTTSRFTFSFGGPRHLNYYIFQIFIPILLILGVLWVTFFLRDYNLRIEVAGANLLVFIAFSFSLADNYPRLGYLTFLDAVMATTFAISALVIIYNVFLRRLEMNGQGDRADKIDNVFDWIYPLTILLSILLLYVIFFILS